MKKILKELLITMLIYFGLLMLVFSPAVNGHVELASCILGGECGLLARFIIKEIMKKQ